MIKVFKIQNTQTFASKLPELKCPAQAISADTNCASISNKKIVNYPVPFLGRIKPKALDLKDILYKEKLLEALHMDKKEISSLSSIVGPAEFLNTAKRLAGNILDPDLPCYAKGEGNINILNRDYSANFHIHTLYSDGDMEVPTLLEQAARYADSRVEKLGKGNYFHIAITDHNTLESCEEAIKIIAANPEKYKNLKVVLGCEFSLERGHTVGLCLNPFDPDFQSRYSRAQKERNSDPRMFSFSSTEEFYDYANKNNVIGAIAHPLKKAHQKSLSAEMIKDFKEFKEKLAEFACIEGHYQQYDPEIISKEYRTAALQEANKIGLLSIGGNDNHSENVFNLREDDYTDLIKKLY